jgi:hypothetical protein
MRYRDSFLVVSCHRQWFPGLVPGKRVCGPLRLPDVKPPCSNLAGTLVPAIFFLLFRAFSVVDLDRRPV